MGRHQKQDLAKVADVGLPRFSMPENSAKLLSGHAACTAAPMLIREDMRMGFVGIEHSAGLFSFLPDSARINWGLILFCNTDPKAERAGLPIAATSGAERDGGKSTISR